LAVIVCLLLAVAGRDLVRIGQEYPKDILPFAVEWQLQLAFPIGFGLLAVHFAVRVAEAVTNTPPLTLDKREEG
jgi:TRAP-type C4-dicarboxylate transport system permease small subunit